MLDFCFGFIVVLLVYCFTVCFAVFLVCYTNCYWIAYYIVVFGLVGGVWLLRFALWFQMDWLLRCLFVVMTVCGFAVGLGFDCGGWLVGLFVCCLYLVLDLHLLGFV